MLLLAGYLFLNLASKGGVQPALSPISAEFYNTIPQFAKNQLPYSTLLEMLDKGQVQYLGISLDGDLLVQSTTGLRFYVGHPAPVTLLSKALESKGGKKALVITLPFNAFGPSALMRFFDTLLTYVILPTVPLLLLFAFMARGLMSGFKGGGSFEVVKNTGVRFSDVVGAEDAKQALDEVVDYLKNPQKYAKMGARAPRGVLMEGPPGTGKTLMAKAVAGECGVPFIQLDGARFSSPLMGMGILRVRQLFNQAKQMAPCVIFIDEIDGLGTRNSSPDPGGATQENNRVIGTILTQMDGFDTSEGVVVIAATNHRANLDPALIREGRFDRKCVLDLPKLEERQTLFSKYFQQVPHDAQRMDWRTFARRSAGMSPAGIASAVNKSALRAAKNERKMVEPEDVLEVLDIHQLGAVSTSMHKGITRDLRYRIAVHEIGHATIAQALNLGLVGAVTVIPRARALGVTTLENDDDFENVLLTESKLMNRICMFLGGREAEMLFFGDYSSGASDDLNKASELALAMVGQFGLHSRYGAFSYQPVLNQVREIPQELREDSAKVLEQATLKTKEILTLKKNAIEAAARVLCDRYTLSGKEVQDILAGGQEQSLEG